MRDYGNDKSLEIGAEATPERYVATMMDVFHEIYRVLRDDGTLWLNLGDTFTDGGQGMIPALVALALRSDGWLLRQDIIWYSPNKMPESVTNRCTKSHEHIFLLAKGQGYYYDSVAIEEEMISKPHAPGRVREERLGQGSGGNVNEPDKVWGSDGYKNKRDVWVVPTQGYPGAHFAVYSPRLITPCILAGTSEHGCCATCGKTWERVVAKTRGVSPGLTGGEYAPPGQAPHSNARDGDNRDRSFDWSRNGKPGTNSTLDGTSATRETVGWRKTCGCPTDEVVPCVVLDPFVGSGTTVVTALELGRHGVGIDLSETYLRENTIPRIEAVLVGGGGSGTARKPTVAVSHASPPPFRKLRGSE